MMTYSKEKYLKIKITSRVIVRHPSTLNTNSNKIFKLVWGVIQQANAHGTHSCTTSSPLKVKWYHIALTYKRSQLCAA